MVAATFHMLTWNINTKIMKCCVASKKLKRRKFVIYLKDFGSKFIETIYKIIIKIGRRSF